MSRALLLTTPKKSAIIYRYRFTGEIYERNANDLQSAGVRGPHLQKLDGKRRVPRGNRREQSAFCDHDAAAQRNGAASHGARDGRNDAGYRYPLQAHAGLLCAVAARRRPFRDCHRSKSRGADQSRRAYERGDRQRRIFTPRLGLEGKIRKPHRRTAEKVRLFVRLVAFGVYDGRALLQSRARGVFPPL